MWRNHQGHSTERPEEIQIEPASKVTRGSNIRGKRRVVGDQDDSPQRAELAQITLRNEGAMLSQLRDDVTSKVWWGRIVNTAVGKSRS